MPLTSPSASTLPFSAPSSVAPLAETVRRRRPLWAKVGMVLTVIFTLFVAFLNYYNISKVITPEDKQYIRLYLPDLAEGCAAKMTYAEQIRLIRHVQAVVAARTKGWQGLPEGTPREPKQLYTKRTGMCYDRSRTLEKIYLYLGFDTRHLSLFTRESKIHSYTTVLLHHVPSHAISEVQTKHGWLMVDSNDLWIALDLNGEPVSMHKMQQILLAEKPLQWLLPTPNSDDSFYNNRCIPIYGLYSRHGRFYPPYTSGIPDFRLRGLLYNFDSE
jgi:hypothetical protein